MTAPTFTSVNPARPAEVLGTFAEATAEDVDAAVERAAEAQREWARVPAPARAEIIDRCGVILAARREHVAALVAREAGKILAEAGGYVQDALGGDPIVGDVRGRGLLVGVELVADRATKAPFPRAAAVVEQVLVAARGAAWCCTRARAPPTGPTATSSSSGRRSWSPTTSST